MFNKIKGFFKKSKFAIAAAVTTCMTVLCCVVASASDASDPYSELNSAMTTGFTSTQQAMLTSIGNILPIVLVVVGAILVVNLGIRFFKRHSK